MPKRKHVEFVVIEGQDVSATILEVNTSFNWLGRGCDDDIWILPEDHGKLVGDMTDVVAKGLELSPRAKGFYEALREDPRVLAFNFYEKGIELGVTPSGSADLDELLEYIWEVVQKIITGDSVLSRRSMPERYVRGGLFPNSDARQGQSVASLL